MEGSTEYTQLLYIPAHAPFDLWNREKAAGVKLYVKRVFIMDEAEALLPAYLRFVKGVIDSADLPLNVSRELLQESRDVKAIREGSTKRVLCDAGRPGQGRKRTRARRTRTRASTPSSTPSSAPCSRKAWARTSPTASASPSCCALPRPLATRVSVSLADYKARMKEGQEAIYYITADTLAAAKNSPQLEVFRKKGIEVLLMTDRVDEWALNYLQRVRRHAAAVGGQGRGRPGQAAGRGREEGRRGSRRDLQAGAGEAEGSAQGQGRRTCASPRAWSIHRPAWWCSDGGMSMQLARMLKQAGQKAPEVKPVLEVNAEHPLVKKLEGSAHFDDLAHILFDQALLAEGGLPEDPAAYVKRVNALLVVSSMRLEAAAPSAQSGMRSSRSSRRRSSRSAISAACGRRAAPRARRAHRRGVDRGQFEFGAAAGRPAARRACTGSR